MVVLHRLSQNVRRHSLCFYFRYSFQHPPSSSHSKTENSGHESLNDFSTPLAIHPFANCIYLPSAVLVLTQRADVFMQGPKDVNNMYGINYCNWLCICCTQYRNASSLYFVRQISDCALKFINWSTSFPLVSDRPIFT